MFSWLALRSAFEGCLVHSDHRLPVAMQSAMRIPERFGIRVGPRWSMNSFITSLLVEKDRPRSPCRALLSHFKYWACTGLVLGSLGGNVPLSPPPSQGLPLHPLQMPLSQAISSPIYPGERKTRPKVITEPQRRTGIIMANRLRM